MTSDPALREALDEAADTYPYPIAAACAEVRDTEPRDEWHEWELLSRDVLTPVLTYLSHLLLSDLVATGREPAHLFHRIESVLSRPLAGHYVGFLRETATYYREEDVETAVPDLVNFLLEAEVDGTLTDSGRPLLGELVDFRNRWAHGRIENEDVVENSLRQIRTLTERLLSELGFLTEAPLTLEDGTELMGRDPDLPDEPMPLVTVTAEGVSLRPLLLKLEGRELSVLAEADLRTRRLTYRSLNSYTQFDEDEDGEKAARLFEELKSLLREVRSLEATLPKPDLETFHERAAVLTDRMLSLYGKSDLGKYDPDLYIPRPEWEGEDGRFWDFLEADETLLAIDGEQGTGKSALAARLAGLSEERGHAVWFLNAQRFTFADVSWSGNPFPRYFADRLSYEAPFDTEAIEALAEETGEEERIVLFVDGINEIDALSNKWNRFKAISQLLEWTEQVAHPKLKVVLTFRTEAYTRFNYLEEEDVPDRIGEISFRAASPTETDRTGEDTELSWVNRIEPFTEEQARQLYERLQGLERGMAPDMTWDEIRKGLGDELETFITNPLLFTIFLRAHDGESAIISTDQGELFTRYANGVTGARERQEWPWWKRAYHFLKNGNITKKERFLADSVEKASENGMLSFLQSDLTPSESERDNRIATFLTDPAEKHGLQQLQEGGLLVQEPITKDGDHAPTDRRISFTSELLTQAMDRILRSVEGRYLLSFTITLSLFLFLLIILSLCLGVFFITKDYSYYRTYGIIYASLHLFIQSLGLLYYIVLYLIYYFLSKNFCKGGLYPSSIGLFEYSFSHYLSLKVSQIIITISVFLIFPSFIFLFILSVIPSYGPSFTYIYIIATSSIFVLLVAFLPYVNNYFVRSFFTQPLKVKKSVFFRLYNFSYHSKTNFNNYLFLLFSFLLTLPIVFFHLDIYFMPNIQFSMSNIDLSGNFLTYSVYKDLVYVNDYFVYPAIFLSTLVILGFFSPIWGKFLNRLQFGVYLHKFGENYYDLRYLFISLSFFYFFLIFFGITGVRYGIFPDVSENPFLYKEEENIESVLFRYPALSSYVETSEANAPIATFSDAPSLSPSSIRALRNVPLASLTLSNSRLQQLSLSEWTEIKKLTVTGDSVSLESDDAIALLGGLEVRGVLSNLSCVEDLYPTLGTLNITESSARLNGGLPDLWDSAFIHIRSDGAPRLGWLQSTSSSYIFGFSDPPNLDTQNLSLLRHVSFPASGFNPDVLRKMNNLRWLYLTNSPCDQGEIPTEKQEWCAELDRIESNRSLNIDHASEPQPLVVAAMSLIVSDP